MKRIVCVCLMCLFVLILACAQAEIEPNTMVCRINGEETTFYLQWAELCTQDQFIETRYTSYTPRGDAHYDLTLTFRANYAQGDYDDYIYVGVSDVTNNYSGIYAYSGIMFVSSRSKRASNIDFSLGMSKLDEQRAERKDYEYRTRRFVGSERGGEVLLRISDRSADWETYQGVFAARTMYDKYTIEDAYFDFTLGERHERAAQENTKGKRTLSLPD